MNTTKLTRLTAAVFAAAVVPVGLAATAHASTTQDGCTVTPGAPYFAGTYTAANVPEIIYPYDVECDPSNAAMTVTVKTKTYEQDLANRAGDVDADGINNADDDYIGQATSSRKFGTAGGTKTVLIKGVLPHTDTDSNEEVYDETEFKVKSGNVTGSWTAFELTQPTQIYW